MDSEFTYRSSFAGGFRATQRKHNDLQVPSQGLLQSLDQEIHHLKHYSSQIAYDRQCELKSSAQFRGQKAPQSLEELECLILANKERLKVLEAEYSKSKQCLGPTKEEAPKKGTTQWSLLKTVKGPSDKRTILLK